MMKKNHPIIVTGANGLAGSAVVEHFREKMHTCVIPATRADVDLTDTKATHDFFERVGGDRGPFYVFHAAAQVYGLGGNMANQGKSILNNTLINTNVIEAAHRSGCRKITVMGTNAIYPWPAPVGRAYNEGDIFNGRPHDGEAAYGHAKRHMLAMLEAYQQSYGLEYSYLVSGNLYGPRDRFDPVNGHVLPSLISKFAEALDTGGTVEVWGDGSPMRDFLYSGDLARIVHIMMSEDLKPGPINIGNGSLTSIHDTVQLLCKVTGLSADRVRWNASKPNGRVNCEIDLNRLRALGFTPLYDLERGLSETWKWFRTARKM